MDARTLYHQLPTSDDIDLVSVVRDLFIKEGLGDYLAIAYDRDQHIIDARNKRPEVQRHLLNLYLNLQLMKAKTDSSTIRYCLLPDGEIHDWLMHFRSFVLPFIKDNDILKTPVSRPINNVQ